MVTVIGIRFRPVGKVYYFDPLGKDIQPDDEVIVETSRGVEFGHVVAGPKEVDESSLVLPLKPVLRKATDEDKKQMEENRIQEKEAYGVCVEKIAKHNLPMKLVETEYTFDRGKLIFFFTADGRVDFRELVKDLASVFRTRIELRQIGVRDEAKMVGGIGNCGRELCCKAFLGDFAPVSIKMAKEQGLALNPTKISGLCGRLMCCLGYENEVYVEERKRTKAAARKREEERARREQPDEAEMPEIKERTESPEKSGKEERPERKEVRKRPERKETSEKKDSQDKQEKPERQGKPEKRENRGRRPRRPRGKKPVKTEGNPGN